MELVGYRLGYGDNILRVIVVFMYFLREMLKRKLYGTIRSLRGVEQNLMRWLIDVSLTSR